MTTCIGISVTTTGITVPASRVVLTNGVQCQVVMPVEVTTVTLHADVKERLEDERNKGESYNDAVDGILTEYGGEGA